MEELKVGDNVLITRYINTREGVIITIYRHDLRMNDNILVKDIIDDKLEWYSISELVKI